jgi:isocitrate/isopropylmalate dehydrogenase
MFDFGFGLREEAGAIDASIEAAIARGILTADLRKEGRGASTTEVGDAVCAALEGGAGS